jgi:hypothetical protein
MVRGHDDGCKRKKCPREERVGGTESEACAREVKFQPKLTAVRNVRGRGKAHQLWQTEL